MGEHDQTVLHDDDDDGISNDGRALLAESRAEVASGAAADDDPDEFLSISGARLVHALVHRGKQLVPDTLYVFPKPFLVTEWEALYSSVLKRGGSNFSVASFAPIIDENSRVVGHVGWADGNDICVPEETVRNDRRFWSILQKARLGEERQKTLDMFDRGRGTTPQFPFPIAAASPPPAPKDNRTWRGPDNCVSSPHPSYQPTLLEQARSGPLPEEKIRQYLRDLDCFVKGGGKAFVGRHFLRRGYAAYLSPHPGHPDGEVGSPKTPFSSGYEFLVVVDPQGHLQGVMDVRKNLVTQHEKDLELFLGLLDVALTILMIIDIATISVVLFRVAASWVTRKVALRAIEVAIDRKAKALVELTLDELAAVMGGGVAPKGGREIAASLIKEGKLNVEEMIAHLTNSVRQHPELRRLMAARVLTEQRLTSATLEALGDWARAGGRRVAWKTEAEMVKVTNNPKNLMTLQGNELWINEEAKALKEAREFYKEVVHELASDSLGYRGTGVAKRFIEMPNGMPFTDQTLLENAVLKGDIEGVVRLFAGG